MAAARLLPEDPWVGLAEPAQLAAGWPDLDMVDQGEPSLEACRPRPRAAEDAARAVPGITNSDGASASWSDSRVTLAASNGFRGSYRRTRHGLGATVLAGSGTGMQRDYEYRQATHRADLPSPASIGREAGERAARPGRTRARSPPPGAGGLRAARRRGAAAPSGRRHRRRRHRQRPQLPEGTAGPAVFGAGITVTDDPLRRRGLASRPFDGEGIAGARAAS